MSLINLCLDQIRKQLLASDNISAKLIEMNLNNDILEKLISNKLPTNYIKIYYRIELYHNKIEYLTICKCKKSHPRHDDWKYMELEFDFNRRLQWNDNDLYAIDIETNYKQFSITQSVHTVIKAVYDFTDCSHSRLISVKLNERICLNEWNVGPD